MNTNYVPLCAPQEANLSDTANVLASEGLEEFAIEEGLYDPATGEPFNTFTVGGEPA